MGGAAGVGRALAVLREVTAVDDQEELTPLGFHLAQLPVDVRIGKLIERGITSFTYTYDFGDDWRHRIEIEEITPAIPGIDYPRFVDGERRAPPEDVGGTPGFEEFLNAMAKPRHPERASMVQWYGGVFDPTDISPNEINAHMAKLAKRRAQGRAAYADAKSRDS